MDCTFTELSYEQTGYFSDILNAYVANDKRLAPFFKFPVSREGMLASIAARRKFPVERKLLADTLTEQYKELDAGIKVATNISLLLKENTFTVCTAHQPAIFTGSLFFIYKIIHAIRLAEHLTEQFPDNHFVPVYYMGSEDADLDELGHIFMNGEKITWDTRQKGAIGRMNNKGLEKIIARIEGELLVHPHGSSLSELLKECYLNSPDVQTATLKLIHRLFAAYGLLILIPDSAPLKARLIPIFKDELLNQASAAIVSRTVEDLGRSFKVQAHPRNINLFYLKDDIRERIERQGNEWRVVNTNLVFSEESIVHELEQHPERFSPNVILRGILQETILPDVAFIGGGGELAYWMELKSLFEHYKVSYPMLIVRNSFALIENKWKTKIDRLRLSLTDIFKDEALLLNELVRRDSGRRLTLGPEIEEAKGLYEQMKAVAENIDPTLGAHVEALKARTVKPLLTLEKKMLKAEKRKFEDHRRQLSAIKTALFPNRGLQERVDNFMPFYAKWGDDLIEMIYEHSLSLEQKFSVLVIDEED